MVVALNSSAGHVLALWSESAPEFGRSVEDLADGFETGTNNDSEQLEMAIAASDSLISNHLIPTSAQARAARHSHG